MGSKPNGLGGPRNRKAQLQVFLSMLFEPTDIVELRCIESWEQDGRNKSRLRLRHWGSPKDMITMSKELADLNSESKPANIYFGVCPRPDANLGKSKDIVTCRCLWADVDACPPEKAVERARSAGLPAPSIVVDSGHGTHLYWLLDEAFAVTCPGGREHVESTLKTIQSKVGGDHTQDLARLLRLPGFLNVKNARNGAKPVPCRLVQTSSDARYSLDVFAGLATPLEDQPGNDPETALCEDKKIREAIARLDTVPVGKRSEADFAVCCQCIRAGLDEGSAWQLLRDKSKFAERGREYFERTWNHALERTIRSAALNAIPATIDVLGMDATTGETIMWIRDRRFLQRVSRLGDLTGPRLIQLAGITAMRRAGGVNLIRNGIAEASRRRAFGPHDFIGQGVRRVEGIDGPFILTGDRAGVISYAGGSAEVHEIDVPLIGNKLVEFNAADRWTDLKMVSTTMGRVRQPYPKKLWRALLRGLSCWNFAYEHDCELLAGLILATNIQGVLPFRPHVWVTGETNTGKTALFTFLGRLWPYALQFESETTEAAIRQTIGHSCLPALFDEFEAKSKRQKVLRLLRSATRGGYVFKGTPGHKPVRFGLRHIFWVASTDVALRRAADRNRFIVVELKRPDRIVIPKHGELKRFGQQLLVATLALCDKVCSVYKGLIDRDASRDLGRLVESLALPAAVRAVFLGEDLGKAGAFLDDLIADRREALAQLAEPDYAELVQAILSSTIWAELTVMDLKSRMRSERRGEHSIGTLLATRQGGDELAIHGIRLLGNGNIFIAPKIIEQKLLRGTEWADVNTSDLLIRIPGAERGRQRVAGCNPRGVSVPLSALPLGDDEIAAK